MYLELSRSRENLALKQGKRHLNMIHLESIMLLRFVFIALLKAVQQRRKLKTHTRHTIIFRLKLLEQHTSLLLAGVTAHSAGLCEQIPASECILPSASRNVCWFITSGTIYEAFSIQGALKAQFSLYSLPRSPPPRREVR